MTKIKTITVIGKRWFDKVNGNTYCSARIYFDNVEVCKAIADKFYFRLNKVYESCFEDDFLIEDFLANEMEFLVSEVTE